MLTAGTRLGRFEIEAPLAAGGMGEVYRARDSDLGRQVAIKVLPQALSAHPKVVARFRQEMMMVAALCHQNIVSIHDVGVDAGRWYSVMELLDGETLRRRLARSALNWRKASAIGSAIADGLAAAHARGIVHLDVKPENIFLTASGGVKILDFGISRSPFDQHQVASTDAEPPSSDGPPSINLNEHQAAFDTVKPDDEVVQKDRVESDTEPAGGQRDTALGTPPYMSPEQVVGEATSPTSDIFSLGSVLYEMVTGRRTFTGQTEADTRDAILHDDPPNILDWGIVIPSSLDRVIMRCLEKPPQARFQSASDLAFTLRHLSTSWMIGLPFRLPVRFRLQKPAA